MVNTLCCALIKSLSSLSDFGLFNFEWLKLIVRINLDTIYNSACCQNDYFVIQSYLNIPMFYLNCIKSAEIFLSYSSAHKIV